MGHGWKLITVYLFEISLFSSFLEIIVEKGGCYVKTLMRYIK